MKRAIHLLGTGKLCVGAPHLGEVFFIMGSSGFIYFAHMADTHPTDISASAVSRPDFTVS